MLQTSYMMLYICTLSVINEPKSIRQTFSNTFNYKMKWEIWGFIQYSDFINKDEMFPSLLSFLLKVEDPDLRLLFVSANSIINAFFGV